MVINADSVRRSTWKSKWSCNKWQVFDILCLERKGHKEAPCWRIAVTVQGTGTLRDTEGHWGTLREGSCSAVEVWEGTSFQARCRSTKFQFGVSARAQKRKSPTFACSRKDTASLYKAAAGVVDGTTLHPKLAAIPGSAVCGYWLWSHERCKSRVVLDDFSMVSERPKPGNNLSPSHGQKTLMLIPHCLKFDYWHMS